MRIVYTTGLRCGTRRASVCLMAASALVRAYYYFIVHPIGEYEPAFVAAQILLPLAACALFCALGGGRTGRQLKLTALPVLMGCVFFALKAGGFTPVHRALCLLLYLGVASLYTLTVWGMIPTPVPLILIFGLPLLYHIFVEDLGLLRTAGPTPATLDYLLLESSVLLILVALLCAALALRRDTR